jgi:hypothetical protein
MGYFFSEIISIAALENVITVESLLHHIIVLNLLKLAHIAVIDLLSVLNVLIVRTILSWEDVLRGLN